jgi:endonuclease-8
MEGPSIYILSDLLQPMVGGCIQRAGGNASFEKHMLIGEYIKDIYPYGKRLIIQLSDYAIATHFLMYGSYRIDEERPEKVPRFALDIGAHQLYFYNCSTKCYQRKDLKRSLDFQIDIMSDQWNDERALKALRSNPNETIDDILLDQSIFDGVGNIIKNEVLFLSHVSPHTKVHNLSVKKIKEIIMHAREYSQVFFEARKLFKLRQTMQIYGKKTCPVCGGLVTRGKTGKRERRSFFCPYCQK